MLFVGAAANTSDAFSNENQQHLMTSETVATYYTRYAAIASSIRYDYQRLNFILTLTYGYLYNNLLF